MKNKKKIYEFLDVDREEDAIKNMTLEFCAVDLHDEDDIRIYRAKDMDDLAGNRENTKCKSVAISFDPELHLHKIVFEKYVSATHKYGDKFADDISFGNAFMCPFKLLDRNLEPRLLEKPVFLRKKGLFAREDVYGYKFGTHVHLNDETKTSTIVTSRKITIYDNWGG